MKNTIVYWAGKHPVEHHTNWNIVYNDPQPLMSTYVHDKDDRKMALMRCPAFTDKVRNTFILTNPIACEYHIIGPQNINRIPEQGVTARVLSQDFGPNTNTLFSLDMSYYFFSEDDIELTLEAPYFSKTGYLDKGSLIPGRFNISKWFRPVNIELNLWAGVDRIKFEENEPLAYVSFNTDKNIIFKRFNLSPELYRNAVMLSNGTGWEPKVSLAKRYQRFVSTRTNKLIMKEIQQNLF